MNFPVDFFFFGNFFLHKQRFSVRKHVFARSQRNRKHIPVFYLPVFSYRERVLLRLQHDVPRQREAAAMKTQPAALQMCS